MAKGNYFFPLYYQRLLTSTTGWKDDAFGAYVKLLIYQFDKGSIPGAMSRIVVIAPAAKKHWALLSEKFVDDGNGNLINPIMDEVRKRAVKKSETNSANAKKGKRTATAPAGENETNAQPNGGERTGEPPAIPITSNHNSTIVELAVVGSEAVAKIANEAWMDKHWRDQLCIGLNIKNEDHLKRWMAQFNSSIANDRIHNFDAATYKKMIRGWIVKQQQKGTKIEDVAQQPTQTIDPNFRLKKIS